MISMFTWTARSLVRTEDSMAIPCSVKTYGAYFRCFPRPVFKAPDWLLKEADSFKDYCALLFMKGALLKDPKGILVQQPWIKTTLPPFKS
jgi:hypothetical protein